ncbi:MAG: hypothetical protein R2713_15130 [Ilumatobacteraceae bacterium]
MEPSCSAPHTCCSSPGRAASARAPSLPQRAARAQRRRRAARVGGRQAGSRPAARWVPAASRRAGPARSRASGGRVRGRTIPPEQAFGDYLDLKGIGAVLRKAASAASLDMVAASTPGLEHLLVLGKVKELERTRAADLLIVDAPPAGHAAPFLRSASALQEVISSGPVRDQADEVAAMLADARGRRRCSSPCPRRRP